ncbi:SusC/RagA family TonB-linked outer membrane protein [Ancylomarina sp. 16SWW S1-10-2]|uniref:SusC/RagA family TonB-linked outer membrane protein n=1 Tax=Ancylomarina sp. 16SWW S1-10-2 TaxID=2499681 RepID=UPI00189DD6BD|nr:SusC/RagA family TonB-linked outer membrane protein [Ancylomarina sp. 16SWW S1-10-2]
MKLAFILTVVCSLQLSASVYSQNTRLSLSVNKSSLVEVFKEIRNNSEFSFVYDLEDVESVQNVSLNTEDASVEEILEACFENTNLTYEIVDKVVVIKQKPYVAPVQEKAQEKKELKGTVTDEDGNTLPGVSVVVKGTSIGVATNIDGNYSIQIEGNNALLVYSFVGMEPQEVVYNGQSVYNVTLKADAAKMAEVVVTGYQTISKERSTGAFAKVSVKALEERSTLNVMDKLEGQASGVLFDKSGNITIRGGSSMYANTYPLVVVDGFPIEGDLESLNPNDIESMTILKDAAAASIWGAKAANGVIIIVSKKGTKGKARVEFSSTLSITGEPDLYSLKRASTESFLEMEKHFADNGWKQLAGAYVPGKPAFNEGLNAYLKFNAGQMTETEKDAIINRLKGIDVRDQYADLFLRKAVRQNYHLSVSGASEKSNYYASLSYDDNDSFMKNNDNDRFVSNLRIQTKLSDRVSFNAGISATLRNSKNNGATSLSYLPQYQEILDANGDYIAQPYGYDQESKDIQAANNNVPYDWTYNAYQEFENQDNSRKDIDLRMQAGLTVKLIKGLSFEGRYQYEFGNQKTLNMYNEDTYRVRNSVNTYAFPDVDQWTGQTVMQYPIPMGNARYDQNDYARSYTTRGQFNFDRSFDDGKHQIYAIGGVEFRQVKSESASGTQYGFDPVSLEHKPTDYYSDNLAAFSSWPYRITDDVKYSETKDRYASYYGNGGYTYDEKYTVTGSVRLDDSNVFGVSDEYRNVPLWSVGANWQLSKENFINSDFINRLTLRATYGTGGNIDKTTSPFLTAAISQDYQTGYQYAYIQNPKNPNLRWEKTATTNIGVDYALWNNRLTGSIEYYSKESVDLLGNVSINAIYGISSAKMNTGEMTNKGIDFSVNVGILNKDFKWNAIANFSYNKNRVEKVELPDESIYGAISSYNGYASNRVGKPLSHLYSYKWAGLSAEGKPQVYNKAGDIIDDFTELEEVADLKYEGTTIPKYYGSLQNVLSYKGVRLSMLITYKLGHKFRKPTISYSSLRTDYFLNELHEDFDDRWIKAGDEKVTDIPVLLDNPSDMGGYWGYYTAYGSHNVESASHIRFKDVVLSYDLPKSWFQTIGLKALNVGAQVRNLGVITFNDSNIDPENIIGVSGFGKIRPEYTFSLKARF